MGLLEKVNSTSYSYNTLEFLVDEAQYVKSALQEPSYLDLFIKKMCSLENCVEVFIQPYLVDYSIRNMSQLDVVIQVAKPDPSCILMIMKTNFKKQGYRFDEASRYLLNKLDLCLTIKQDEELFEDVFDVLTEEVEEIATEDLTMINKLYRSSRKKHMRLMKESKPEPTSQIDAGLSCNIGASGSIISTPIETILSSDSKKPLYSILCEQNSWYGSR